MQYSNIQEVANTYKVTKNTVRNWIKQGMPHLKAGSVLRFDLAAVDEWLRSR